MTFVRCSAVMEEEWEPTAGPRLLIAWEKVVNLLKRR